MNDYASLCRSAALAQAILSAIEKHEIPDHEAQNVLINMFNTLSEGFSDWASEIIYEANELDKDGREER